MKIFWALVVARNKEFYRDTTTLGWTFVFPLLVIMGFAFGYSGGSGDLFKVGVLHTSGKTASAGLHDFLQTKHIEFVALDDASPRAQETAINKLRHHQLDLLIDTDDAGRYWINSTSSKGSLAEKLMLSSNSGTRATATRQAVEGRELRYVEWLVPGILAMNMMFSSLFGVGYTIVRYRKNGVLKRLKATPASAFQFLTAQVLSRLLLILCTNAIVFFGARLLIRFPMNGSILAFFTFVAVGAIAMISLGLIVASRISSEEVAEGVLNVFTWPMMFLSGIWFSLEGASPAIRFISRLFPLTHIVDGMRAIVIDGATLTSLAPQIGFLAVLSVVFIGVGSVIFKWS